MEIIMVRPNTPSANLLCDNVVYETQDYAVYSQKIEKALDGFKILKSCFPNQVIIRLSDKVPPYGMVAADLESEKATMKIELYTYSVPTRERIQLNVTKSDEKMLRFFMTQLADTSSLVKSSCKALRISGSTFNFKVTGSYIVYSPFSALLIASFTKF